MPENITKMQYENLVFTTYVVLWCITGLIFFYLNLKAKSIEKKKHLDTIGFMIIASLMLGALFLLDMPTTAKPIATGVLGAVLCIGFVLTKKYTFYCSHCLKKTQHLFTTLSYCPKCGHGKTNE